MIVASVDTVRALVAPLVPGDVVVAGWRLESGVARADGAVVYRLATAGEGWDVVVGPLDASASAWARTKHLNVSVSSDQPLTGLSASASGALRAFLAVLEANDVALARGVTPASGFSGAKATLWLAPGHIGNPRDLSLRALDLLDRCALWLVEEGKTDLVRGMLPPLGVATAEREIREVADGDSVEALVDVLAPYLGSQRDVCLFGADEGIPGFVDPGSRVLEAASRCGAAVRSVGGASVLGTALMRVDERFQTFTFVGHAGMGWTDQALFDELARSPRPLVFFTTGAWCRASAERLGRAVARRRGTIRFLCDLTEPAESVVLWDPHQQRAAPEIAGDRVVVFVAFGPRLPERIVRGIRAWWQRA